MKHALCRHGAALLLVVCTGMASASSPVHKPSWPMRQGLHEFSVAGGKVMLVVGSYQDTTSFWRSYQLYFVGSGQAEWHQVPRMAKPDDVQFSLTSSGGGDHTLDDWVALKRGAKFYMVRAVKRTGTTALAKGDVKGEIKGEVKVTWYQLVEASNDVPDAPAYYLKPVFTRHYGGAMKLDVDAVLAKELTLQPVD